MKFERLAIPDVVKIKPKAHRDGRGEFTETFRSRLFSETIGHNVEFVQDNQSISTEKHTLRGLHYQVSPHEQGKLVRCVKGEILDVAVDVRVGSPTFGRWIAERLSLENKAQLWIPQGFLHGFLTLQPETIVLYKCTAYYAPNHDRSIKWNDPQFAIDWGIDAADVILSDKDRDAPFFEASE